MIGAGLALVVVGIVLVFMLPWVGLTVGIVGIVLAALWLLGFGRRALHGEQPADRRA